MWFNRYIILFSVIINRQTAADRLNEKSNHHVANCLPTWAKFRCLYRRLESRLESATCRMHSVSRQDLRLSRVNSASFFEMKRCVREWVGFIFESGGLIMPQKCYCALPPSIGRRTSAVFGMNQRQLLKFKTIRS